MVMLNLPWLLISVLSSFALGLSVGQALRPNAQHNIWESFAPGGLLRLLERSTLSIPDSLQNSVAHRRSDVTSPVNTKSAGENGIFFSTPKSIQKRTDSSSDNTYTVEDQLNAPSSDEVNYDQAYEDFVRRYFSDKLAEDNDSSGNNEEALEGDTYESDEHQFEKEHSSSAAETEPLTEETKNRTQRKSKEKCHRVRKHKQNCLICENARSGEKSESCSYSHESEPQNYDFERERSYKKQRDTEEPSSQSLEQTSSEEAEAAEIDKSVEEVDKRSVNSKRVLDKVQKGSSTCIQMVKRGKICYQCVDGEGPTTKCYMPRERKSAQVNNKAHPAKGKERKVQKTQQRIYKRTISYSFEKGTNGTATDETPVESYQLENATASSAPHLKEKIFIKVVKQNETIAE